MSSDPVPPTNPAPSQRPLSPATMAVVAILLLIPLAALALVPVYAKADPHLWGFPFFYWYQFLWVFLASGFTFAAYLVIERARRGGDR
jgi:Protein of unknown function (DUF3311)